MHRACCSTWPRSVWPFHFSSSSRYLWEKRRAHHLATTTVSETSSTRKQLSDRSAKCHGVRTPAHLTRTFFTAHRLYCHNHINLTSHSNSQSKSSSRRRTFVCFHFARPNYVCLPRCFVSKVDQITLLRFEVLSATVCPTCTFFQP